MRQINYGFLFLIFIINLCVRLSAQNLMYYYKDDFNDNSNNWRLVNTSEFESKIDHGYLSISNKTNYMRSYFRSSKNVIPKSAKYEITAKMSFNKFNDLDSLIGGIVFIRSEEVNNDGSYSTVGDDFRIGFTKYQNKSFIILEGFDFKVFTWKPIDVELKENNEYVVKIIINNTRNSEQIEIKIDDKSVFTYSLSLHNFNNIGFFNYPGGSLKVNSFEIKSYDGNLDNPFDIFYFNYTVDENKIINSLKYKSREEMVNELYNFMPKELEKFISMSDSERNIDDLFEKLMLNPDIIDYMETPVEKNEHGYIERHCFLYKEKNNIFCLPVFLMNNKKIINGFEYASIDNRRSIIQFSNIVSSLFKLTNIKKQGEDIIVESKENNWHRLYIYDQNAVIWF